ncbi:CHAT domain-containing protein [Kamptonema formosum]|uniref:CHAT domain-containing protein n=1 Tax=Kamptonema formosum TaxID=331992 RepID=UPI0018E24BAF|nr:CHAT domain-containing protein [Oscillatoria sp. PCC 10802]
MGLILSINVRALPAERIQSLSPSPHAGRELGGGVNPTGFSNPHFGQTEMPLSETKALSQTPTGTELAQQGTTLYESGQFQEAAIVWQQAASAFQKQGDTLNQAMALSNLSLTYQQVGEWQKAAQSIEESLKLLPATQGASAEELRVIAQTRDIEGNLQLAVGQAEKALANWQQTASIYDKLSWEEGKNQSWLNQARALQDLGLYPRAGETLMQIFGSDFTRVSKLSKEDANSWLQEFSDSPSPIKAVALRSLGDILRQVGNLDLSQKVLERSSASETSPNPGELAQRVFEALQVAELDNFFRDPCAEVVPVRIGEFLNKQAQKSAVIYPIIVGNRLEILLQLPNQGLLHRPTVLPRNYREVLDSLYRTLYQETKTIFSIQNLNQEVIAEKFQTNSEKLQPILQEVYNWLIKPIEKDLASVSGVNTLVFVLDGPLQNIPIAALYDGKKYLVEKYSVALTPGLQLLDPKPLPREDFKVLAAGVSEANQGKDPLPAVPDEVNTIVGNVGRGSKGLLNDKFTPDKFKAELKSGSFPVVHIATHGEFSSNPEKTLIYPWRSDLNFNELKELLQTQTGDKAIELLVLSACETAQGDRRAVLGLAGVAVRAGARSTLATLWNVEDTSAKELMVKFYQELARDKDVTKAEALSRAQRTLLQDKNYNHPAYWAPYVLIGNWL